MDERVAKLYRKKANRATERGPGEASDLIRCPMINRCPSGTFPSHLECKQPTSVVNISGTKYNMNKDGVRLHFLLFRSVLAGEKVNT